MAAVTAVAAQAWQGSLGRALCWQQTGINSWSQKPQAIPEVPCDASSQSLLATVCARVANAAAWYHVVFCAPDHTAAAEDLNYDHAVLG